MLCAAIAWWRRRREIRRSLKRAFDKQLDTVSDCDDLLWVATSACEKALEPWPCNTAAETPLQPLILFFTLIVHASSSPERLFRGRRHFVSRHGLASICVCYVCLLFYVCVCVCLLILRAALSSIIDCYYLYVLYYGMDWQVS